MSNNDSTPKKVYSTYNRGSSPNPQGPPQTQNQQPTQRIQNVQNLQSSPSQIGSSPRPLNPPQTIQRISVHPGPQSQNQPQNQNQTVPKRVYSTYGSSKSANQSQTQQIRQPSPSQTQTTTPYNKASPSPAVQPSYSPSPSRVFIPSESQSSTSSSSTSNANFDPNFRKISFSPQLSSGSEVNIDWRIFSNPNPLFSSSKLFYGANTPYQFEPKSTPSSFSELKDNSKDSYLTFMNFYKMKFASKHLSHFKHLNPTQKQKEETMFEKFNKVSTNHDSNMYLGNEEDVPKNIASLKNDNIFWFFAKQSLFNNPF